MSLFKRISYVLIALMAGLSNVIFASDFLNGLLKDTTQTLRISQGSAFSLIGIAFLAGVLTSLLPCIYPMIPITLGILQGQGAVTVRRNFQLAFAYVNGMAIVYAVLGYISARFAIIFGSWLGNVWFVGAMVLFFLYMAGSMLGFYELYIPKMLQEPAARIEGGSITQCFVLGMLSATVASPCVAPPLAVLIGLVAHHANPLLGFAALYAFSLGMGLPLLLVGTFSGTLNMLPRAGGWLERVKQFFGFVLLGVCVYFIQSFVGIRLALGFYASITLAALWFFVYQFYVAASKRNNVTAARLSLLVACILTILIGLYFQYIFFKAVSLLPKH
ncbi:hypothetical protein FJ364_06000 [Candidatus Dependentiae bacterium]|nr:hypothetical protein [Candidatus Dependentiae bacterium]